MFSNKVQKSLVSCNLLPPLAAGRGLRLLSGSILEAKDLTMGQAVY